MRRFDKRSKELAESFRSLVESSQTDRTSASYGPFLVGALIGRRSHERASNYTMMKLDVHGAALNVFRDDGNDCYINLWHDITTVNAFSYHSLAIDDSISRKLDLIISRAGDVRLRRFEKPSKELVESFRLLFESSSSDITSSRCGQPQLAVFVFSHF